MRDGTKDLLQRIRPVIDGRQATTVVQCLELLMEAYEEIERQDRDADLSAGLARLNADAAERMRVEADRLRRLAVEAILLAHHEDHCNVMMGWGSADELPCDCAFGRIRTLLGEPIRLTR
jgi:hypothetical protein